MKIKNYIDLSFPLAVVLKITLISVFPPCCGIENYIDLSFPPCVVLKITTILNAMVITNLDILHALAT